MKNSKVFGLVVVGLLAVTAFMFNDSRAAEQEEAVARLVADYLVAGRAVIAKNQALINDETKGDKGFTPAVFEEQVRAEFKQISGLDIKAQQAGDPVGKALLDVHASAMEVVGQAQPLINQQGRGYKGFIPAVFGARTGDNFYRRSGIRLKQTSLRYRADYNQPDELEARVLAEMESEWEKGKDYSEVVSMGGRSAVRYIRPIYIAAPCLACHGEPAGELDIAGREKEGYQEGDLRGGISVTVQIR